MLNVLTIRRSKLDKTVPSLACTHSGSLTKSKLQCAGCMLLYAYSHILNGHYYYYYAYLQLHWWKGGKEGLQRTREMNNTINNLNWWHHIKQIDSNNLTLSDVATVWQQEKWRNFITALLIHIDVFAHLKAFQFIFARTHYHCEEVLFRVW